MSSITSSHQDNYILEYWDDIQKKKGCGLQEKSARHTRRLSRT